MFRNAINDIIAYILVIIPDCPIASCMLEEPVRVREEPTVYNVNQNKYIFFSLPQL